MIQVTFTQTKKFLKLTVSGIFSALCSVSIRMARYAHCSLQHFGMF